MTEDLTKLLMTGRASQKMADENESKRKNLLLNSCVSGLTYWASSFWKKYFSRFEEKQFTSFSGTLHSSVA